MYYYEHENGSVIQKPDYVVNMAGGPAAYFDSPFCKRWWHETDGLLQTKEGELE